MTEGSSWRREPAAELRGLAKVACPSAARRWFSFSKPASDMYTSPRISIRAGNGGPPARRRRGISLIVRRLRVTSSPMVPLPRVAPFASTPSSYVRAMASPSILGSAT